MPKILITEGVLTVGRYALHDAIASGGMGTVHLGRAIGAVGFTRTVAIKRLHPHLLADPTFVEMFADEARLSACIHHPNVVPTLDVVSSNGELLLVMEYVDGESLARLTRDASGPIPLAIAVAIMTEVLHGLHAAHEATSESGEPLGIVHRDVSPQNVIVGADGVARLVDFGLARTAARLTTTVPGDLKGKLAYMAPEQLRGEKATQASDVFAAGVVLWELLTGKRLFASDQDGGTLEKILVGWVPPPSTVIRRLPPALDAIALRALDADPAARFATAREMAMALEDAVPRALGRDVAAWVASRAAPALAARRERLRNLVAPSTPEPQSEPEIELEPTTYAPRRERSRSSVLGLVFMLAGVLAVPLAMRLSGVANAAAATAPRPIETARAPEIVPSAPEPIATQTAEPAPAPPPPVKRVEPRRATPAPRPVAPIAAAHVPCTAKYDVTTRKTVYQGDCD